MSRGTSGSTLAHEAAPENDRPVRTLRAMGRIMKAEGNVAFRDDDQAGRFAAGLRERYGEGIVKDLASGKTEALAWDIEDETERRWVARAVVAAAKAHAAIGLTLREAARADQELGDHQDTAGRRDRER